MRNLSLSEPIDTLNLSIRTYNALRRAEIITLGDLLDAKRRGVIQEVRNIGEKSYNEILTKLKSFQIGESDYDIEIDDLIKQDIDDENIKYASIIKKYEAYRDVFLGLVKWQIEQINKQISMGTLHKDAFFGRKKIVDILENTEEDLVFSSKVYSGILKATCLTEELAYLIDEIDSRDLNILIQYYGFTHHTLEEISVPLDITRERVRQILQRAKKIISTKFKLNFIRRSDFMSPISFVRMQTAIIMAKELGDEITFDQWTSLITQSGLLGNWKIHPNLTTNTIEIFLAICKVLSKEKVNVCNIPENLLYACELAESGKPDISAKILIIQNSLDKKIRRKVKRHEYFSGGVNAKWLSLEIDLSMHEIKDILKALSYVPIGEDWYILDTLKKKIKINKFHPFEHNLRKMFQYCGPLSIENICSGLQHAVSRTRYPIPPSDIMNNILEKRGYTNEEGLWYWDGEIYEELSAGEKVIIKCFKENGPIVHHSELAQYFIDSYLSFASLHATLSKTPLVEKFDYALYKLRGLKVTYEEIQRAKNEGDRVSVNLEIIPDKTGVIKIVGSLVNLPVGTGAFYSENLPNLTGEWQCFVLDRQCGEVTVVENEIRGLLNAFERLQCEVGDRVSMSFNTWDRNVSIEKVDNNEN